MKYTTSVLLFGLIFLFSCAEKKESPPSAEPLELSEEELTRVTMLIEPAPKTYQEEQVNQLIKLALEHNWPVRRTASGLLYWIEESGNDQRATLNNQILVRYKGQLIDGKVFDQSPVSGEPVAFPLNQMIPAWQEALPLIGEGGKIKILAHSDLGYKSQQIANVIPAYSPLIFEVELINIQLSE